MENISNVGEQVLNNKNNKILVMTGLMIGIIFSELDETVVNTAMPTIF